MEFLVRLENEIKEFKYDLYKICWYMRGGVQLNDLMDRYSYDDRQIMYDVIDSNIKSSQENQMPLI
jgi:hypothetical protein